MNAYTRAIRVVLLFTLHSSLITSLACDKASAGKEEKIRDTQAPEISVTEPNVPYGVEGISIKEDTIKLSGMAEDDRGVLKVKWENDRGGKGVAYTKFEGGRTSWDVPEVKLEPGDNRITVTALDAAMNKAVQTLWVIRNTHIEFISFPDASETDIRLSESTEVIFRVAIKENPKVKIEGVKLVKVNENNETLDTLGTMYDDGKSEHGDEVPADGVFSAKVQLLEGTEGKIRFRVVVSGVKEDTGGVTALSEPFTAKVFRLWTEEEREQAISIDAQAEKMYFDLVKKLGLEEAGRRTAEWLKKQPGVRDAGAWDDFPPGFSFVMESGIPGGWFPIVSKMGGLLDPNTMRPLGPDGTPAPGSAVPEVEWNKEEYVEDCLGDKCTRKEFKPGSEIEAPPAPPRPKKPDPLIYKINRRAKSPRARLINPKVIVVSVFPNSLDPRAYDQAYRTFQGHKCPAFKAKRIRKTSEAGVDSFKTLKDYNVVVLDTHGTALCNVSGKPKPCPCGIFPPSAAVVVTQTGTPVTPANDAKYAADVSSGQIVGTPLFAHYVMTPSFVSKYNKSFSPNAVVYNGSCRSSYNNTMAEAFLLGGGVEAYFGYSENVFVPYDSANVLSLFGSLLKGTDVLRAYQTAIAANGAVDSLGVVTPAQCTSALCTSAPCKPAAFMLAAQENPTIIPEGFNNGSFEDGAPIPVGWDTKGDVRIITKLGTITAKDGNWMAFLTTGEKSENEVGSTLSQPFCVPANVNKVTFDYRLVSEEPLEFVNSAWRDTFEASLDVAGAKTVLVAENTDKGPWSPLSGVDFEGGDHTAFATDWKRISSELPDTARTEGATLAFLIRDGGDYIYDTSVLIDGVRME